MYRIVPAHLGIVPDGNRRYAQKMNIPVRKAYETGVQKLIDVLDWSKEAGIRTVTSWGFSTENLKRNSLEKRFLFSLFEKKIKEMIESGRFRRNQVRINVVGNRAVFPSGLVSAIEKMEEQTRHYNKLHMNLALGYGGRQEIVDACNAAVASGTPVDVSSFSKLLSVTDDVDMVMRTSGEQRLSGFLPWQATYAEFIFLKPLWPEITEQDFFSAVDEFSERKRNFGR